MNYLKKISIGIVGILAIGGCSVASECSSKKSDKPNIIFFIADDMYPEMFNCLNEGEDQYLTPNIDRLAREGVLMANQHVVSPVCTPSRYNCLTGRYASRAINPAFIADTESQEGQTVIKWNTFITDEEEALPHYLQDLGYTTGMVGKNHVVEVKNYERFKDYWADPRDPKIKKKLLSNYNKTRDAIMGCGFDYAESVYFDNPNFIGLGKLAVQNMDWIAQGGVDFIDANADKPFFLYFATTVPHGPVEAKRSWKADPTCTAKGFLKEAPTALPARETLPARIKESGLKGKNLELVLWLDDALGALINKLEEKDVLDNTIIFFFNDHGQKAKGTLYEGGTHSPSIIWKSGGFECGNESGTFVQNIDFAPTIVEMAGGCEKKHSFDGKSFKAVLEGKTDTCRDVFFNELGYARAITKGNYKYMAIRYPDYMENMTPETRAKVLKAYNEPRIYKKMTTVNDDPMAPFSHFSDVPGGENAEHESYGKRSGYFDRDQLYDLSKDPGENVNLANDPKYVAVLSELKSELRNHLAEMPGKFDL